MKTDEVVDDAIAESIRHDRIVNLRPECEEEFKDLHTELLCQCSNDCDMCVVPVDENRCYVDVWFADDDDSDETEWRVWLHGDCDWAG